MNETLVSPASQSKQTSPGMNRLLIVFALSGAAALVYQVVWFELLRLTIGANSQALGILLAAFMAGLFLGSLFYARVAPQRWHPLRTYVVLEVGIAAFGLAMPWLIGSIRTLYLWGAESPQYALLLRSVVCLTLLVPPTILMGATLPALARWIRSDERQAAGVGWLYAGNIVGAVAGAFGSALLLLPAFGIVGATIAAVVLNVAAALIVLTIRSPYVVSPEVTPSATPAPVANLPVFLSYGLSGMAALSFQVLWARLLSTAFGATVYAFALVLGIFLLGLAAGSAVGSWLSPRITSPRRALFEVQLAVLAAVGATSLLVPTVAGWWVLVDMDYRDNLWMQTLTNLLRTTVVVLPGAFLWGMSFPVALRCLGTNFTDAARPVGRLYAFNTMGAVVGALATSFILIPTWGSSQATAFLVLLPLLAAGALLWPPRLPAWPVLVLACAGAFLVFGSSVPIRAAEWLQDFARHGMDHPHHFLYLALLPAFLGTQLFLVRQVPRRLILGGAGTGLLLAFGTAVPAELYMLGRNYAIGHLMGQDDRVILFQEGASGPVVVHRDRDGVGPLKLSINGLVCATTEPQDMMHLRLLGHLPVLLSSDPSDVLVVGLGAGVTAGCAALHEQVRRVDVVELEPKVLPAAALFAEANHGVLDNPKTRLILDDGRHVVSTSGRKYGVITSDPIDPYWAGAAALYTVEYYRLCRSRLVDGGIFMQWLGFFGIDEESMRSLLAAFAEAFPDGRIWLGPGEIMMVGSTGPIRIDVEALRDQLDRQPAVSRSLAEVGIESGENLLSRHLCSFESLRDYLAGARVNRDADLIVQHRGWQTYYQSLAGSDQHTRALVERHLYEEDLFLLSDHERPMFRESILKEWERVRGSVQQDEPG